MLTQFERDLGFLAAIVTGLLTHAAFKRKEPSVWFAINSGLAALAGIAATLHLQFELPLREALLQGSKYFGTLLASLALSILIYRVAPWHPLAQYPGPLRNKLTQFAWAQHVYAGNGRKELKRLHEIYGKVVRIGPNELSLADANTINPIHVSKGFIRSQNYNNGPSSEKDESQGSLARLRHRDIHKTRRKIWDPSVTPSALQSFHPQLYKRTFQLMDLFSQNAGKTIDLHDFAGFYTFDVTMDLAYGSEAFGDAGSALDNAYDKDHVINEIVDVTRLALRLDSLPWLQTWIGTIKGAGSEMERIGKFVERQFKRRITQGSATKDMFSYLLAEDKTTGKKLNFHQLANDSFLIVIGGSDTTSTSYCLTMMFLIKHPEWYKKLQSELDEKFANEEASILKLASMPILDACWNEALRILAPLPAGLSRIPPPEGANVAGYWVPPGTVVRNPSYVITRDPDYFSPAPLSYRPDRWLHPEKEQAFESKAHVPFTIGAYACVGKPLAIQELRCAIAWTVMRFNMKFAPGFDPDDWLENSFRDSFILQMFKGLEVIVEERKDVNHVYPQSA